MLIIPLRSEHARRSMPWMVVLLIVVNALLFTGQYGDDAKRDAADRDYRNSVLFAIEPDLYREWLLTHPPPKALPREFREALQQQLPHGPLDAQTRALLGHVLQIDGAFLDALASGRLVDTRTPQGQAWREARQRFEQKLQAGLTGWGAFVPREHRPHTVVASMFLHADPLHLIGNMVFLWLAGMLLEPLLGSAVFLAVYLGTGLLSCAASWAVSPGSAIMELGASGAISGIMGCLATVYGRQRIPCLINVGLHVWRTALHGYWLAVIWIGWELVQQLLFPSNVNRIAHLGGLVGGALLGLALTRRPQVAQRAERSVTVDADAAQRVRAKRQASELAFDAATATMLAVAQRSQQPDDWAQLWAYARHVPRSAAGQDARQRILSAAPQQRGALRTTLMRLQGEIRVQGSQGLPGSEDEQPVGKPTASAP